MAAIRSKAAARVRSTTVIGRRTSSRRSPVTSCVTVRRWRSASTLDTRYSVQIGMLPAGAEERVHALLKRLGFHLWHPALETRDDEGRSLVLDGMRGIPRAPGRRADGHVVARHRSSAKRSKSGLRARSCRPLPGCDAGKRPMRRRQRPSHATARTFIPARPGPRSAPISSAICRASSVESARTRRSEWDCVCRPRRRGRWRRPTPLPSSRLSARERFLRLHHQRFSLRAVPRHAGEGKGLPAGLGR